MDPSDDLAPPDLRSRSVAHADRWWHYLLGLGLVAGIVLLASAGMRVS